MTKWRRSISAGLVCCLYHISLIQALTAAPAFNPASIKQQVEDFGVGAKVGMKLAGGERLRGSIEAVDEQGFVVSVRNGPSHRIAYDQVAQVKLNQRAYRAKDETDPAAARRVVVGLGVGRHAVVKFSGRELHGNIQSIDETHFTLMPDHETAPVEIPFDQVRYVEKNITLGSTIVLVVLIVAAVVAIGAVH
jgi:ribosome maturation factor RimP